MTVYVDDANIAARVQNGSRTHTSRWCHMTADTTEELLTMARKLRLKDSWIQYPGTPLEHFDLTSGKRAQAVRLGVTEITWREGVAQLKAKRDGRPFDLKEIREREELI